jgi:uncharacterized membrane protein
VTHIKLKASLLRRDPPILCVTSMAGEHDRMSERYICNCLVCSVNTNLNKSKESRVLRRPALSNPAFRTKRRKASEDEPEGNPPDTVREMVALEQRARIHMTWSDHTADRITAFSGSMFYVWLHVVLFSLWIALNTPVVGWNYDPFPFGLLTMIVSLEAIFLATFVLISQNRQALLSDKRAKLDLQVNLIAEQEVTKLLELVAEIHRHLGIEKPDEEELKRMQQPTQIEDLTDAVDALEAQVENGKRPHSAADTEA